MDPHEQLPPPDSFELNYGILVADLIDQARLNCHDQVWIKMAASQLTVIAVAESGLEQEEVRAKLNAIWTHVNEIGVPNYLVKMASLSHECE